MDLPKRKSPRIKGYDYSTQNHYFVTICTHEKRWLFGQANNLNLYGKIAKEQIIKISSHYYGVTVDKYVVMPNHIHMLIFLDNSNKNDLNQIIAQYKSGVSREIRKIEPGVEVWQRSYHDHIIRSQASYEKIWLYIEANPVNWEKDCFYTDTSLESAQ